LQPEDRPEAGSLAAVEEELQRVEPTCPSLEEAGEEEKTW